MEVTYHTVPRLKPMVEVNSVTKTCYLVQKECEPNTN